MKAEELQVIRKRSDKATQGEWRTLSGVNENEEHTVYVVTGDYVDEGEPDMVIEISESEDAVADAEFIAHARRDVPKLLDEIDRLTTENTYHSLELDRAREDIRRFRSVLVGELL